MKMELKYSAKPEGKTVKAIGRDMNVSFKDVVMISDAIRGMKVSKAIAFMNDVIALKRSVPYRRFRVGIGHRSGRQPKIGKYPKKAAGHVLAVLRNLEANAEFRGYDAERMKLVHVQALRGISRVRRKPRGRWTMWKTEYCHIQMIAKET